MANTKFDFDILTPMSRYLFCLAICVLSVCGEDEDVTKALVPNVQLVKRVPKAPGADEDLLPEKER